MLHKETVSRSTLDILKKLMSDGAMKDFVLVGGTALALRLGHRVSIDLDLFTDRDFDPSRLNEHLREVYGFSADFMSKNTLKGVLEGIALDLVAHKYDWVDEVSETDGIRLAGSHCYPLHIDLLPQY